MKKVTFVPLADETTALMALESGELHISQIENVRLLTQYQNHEKLNVITAPRVSVHMILMNTKRPPFSDRRVRQALNHAVNTDEIVTGILSGFADKPVGVVHPDMFGFTGDVQKYPYDPAKAKALLAEAGYPNGFKTKVVLFQYGHVAEDDGARKGAACQGECRYGHPGSRGAPMSRQGARRRRISCCSASAFPRIRTFSSWNVFHSKNIPPGGLNCSRYDGVDQAHRPGKQRNE